MTQNKYDCSVCLIIRDENEYLEEWLLWHLAQGVEHFYIYDHESKVSVFEFIKSLGRGLIDKVTVINWSGQREQPQTEAYDDCINTFKHESKWIGVIDADEQIRVKSGQLLPQFLEKYEAYAGLFMTWTEYAADNQEKYEPRPLRERFRKQTEHHWGKTFVQPSRIVSMNAHNGTPVEGYVVVDEHYRIVPEAQKFMCEATTDFICVDHYLTKSYEEWVWKMQRGNATPWSHRYEEFFTFNPDMERCRETVFPDQKFAVSEKITLATEERLKLSTADCYICAAVCQAHDYIREWVLHHRQLGIKKIVLYDIACEKSYETELGTMMQEGFVEIISWENKENPYSNFMHFREWTNNDYAIFLTPNEFIVLNDEKTISSFISDCLPCSEIVLKQKVFNADQIAETKKGEKSLLESDWEEVTTAGKCISLIMNAAEYFSSSWEQVTNSMGNAAERNEASSYGCIKRFLK